MIGVSEVIAIILILMITISLAGLAYMFMSTTMSDVTASAGSTVDTTTSSMLTSFTIENMDIAKVYVRNTGQNTLTGLSVYVNNEPAIYNVTPSSIASGSVGTITIYSFIPDGATIKVTSPSGFSASKVANPCSKAVGCWKFDEVSGTTAYDSSPNGNDGMLLNSPIWTAGKYASGLRFDKTNTVLIRNLPISTAAGSYNTVEFWMFWNGTSSEMPFGWNTSYDLYFSGDSFGINTGTSDVYGINGAASKMQGKWTHVVVGFPNDYPAYEPYIYLNGENQSLSLVVGSSRAGRYTTTEAFISGWGTSGSYRFNGTIDEVRIYNRAIY